MNTTCESQSLTEKVVEIELNPDIPDFPENGIISRAAELYSKDLNEFAFDLLSHKLSFPLDEKATEMVQCMPPMSTDGKFKGTYEADVLVISKMLTTPENNMNKFNGGIVGKQWTPFFNKKKIDTSKWVSYSICPFTIPEYLAGKGQLKEQYAKETRPLLARAVNLIKPKYVLLFGSDALKHFAKLFYKGKDLNRFKFTNYRGTVIDFPGGIKAVCATAPTSVMLSPENKVDLESDLEVFYELISGQYDRNPTEDVNIEVVTSLEEARNFSNKVDFTGKKVSVDLEWGENQTLRTIQLAWDDQESAVFLVNEQGLKPTELQTEWEEFSKLFSSLFAKPKTGIIGHNVRGDIKVLRKQGIDLMPQFLDNGWDTMVAYHLIPGNETLDKKLELVAVNALNTGRYDKKLRDYIASAGLGKKALDKEGYGNIPDDILIPYGAMDAIVTYKLYKYTKEKLSEYPQAYSLYTNVVHPVNDAILEMEENGIYVDQKRYQYLSKLVKSKVELLKAELQEMINWKDKTITVPKEKYRWVEVDVEKKLKSGKVKKITKKQREKYTVNETKEIAGFNPDSVDNVTEILFGHFKTNSKGETLRKSPEDAIILNLTPIKATADNTDWEDVVSAGKEHLYSASTDAETLGILEEDHPFAQKLKTYKFVNQVRKTFIKDFYADENGQLVYEGGLGAFIESDGRLRTSFRITLETGRYSTSPNLQNLPKAQEKELIKLFSKEEYYPIRSILSATPGKVLIEADWNQAELWTMAHLSGDNKFLDALYAGDVHTITTIDMFKDITHNGIKIGTMSQDEFNEARAHDSVLDSYRVFAKSLSFGIPYSRGAKAIARAAQAEGADCDEEQAQEYIDRFKGTYKVLDNYFKQCKDAVDDPGYIVNPYGRYRMFPYTSNDKIRAAMKREAGNFPIQSTVGDTMSVSLFNLKEFRTFRPEIKYDIVLSVHDAIIVETWPQYVEPLLDEVLPLCMTDAALVPNTNLKYKLGTPEVFLRWGEHNAQKELIEMGVPERFV